MNITLYTQIKAKGTKKHYESTNLMEREEEQKLKSITYNKKK